MSLSGKAAKGTIWVAGGTYVVQIVNFLSKIVLMRLLAPEHFGILTLALFFLVLGQKLFAFGFNHALIHRQEDLDRAVPTHQFLHLVTSLLVMALIALCLPLIEGVYDRLTAVVLLVLGASNILQSLGHTPRILLEKELDFSPVMKVNVGATVVADLVAIGLAFFGAGIWALVVRQVIADGVAMGGYLWVSPRPFKIKIDREMIRWYFTFGAYLWLAGMATLITLKFDDFLVGTLVSAKELGYYAQAYAWACLPTTMVAHVVAKVAFPLYAKVQHDRRQLSEAFSGSMRFIVIVTLPLAVGLAILAPEFVHLLFGEKWMPMARMLQLLLIYASLRPAFDNTGELFTAVGKPKTAGVIQMIQAAAVLVFCPLLTWKWGAGGAAVAVGLVMALGVVLAYRQLPRYVTLSYKDIFAVPVASAAVGALMVAGFRTAVFIEGELARFLVTGGVFTFGFCLTCAVLDGRRMVREGQNILAMIRGKKEPTT